MSNHRLTPKNRLSRPFVLGGITAVTALAVLGAEHGLADLVDRAVRAAAARSRELSAV